MPHRSLGEIRGKLKLDLTATDRSELGSLGYNRGDRNVWLLLLLLPLLANEHDDEVKSVGAVVVDETPTPKAFWREQKSDR